MRAAIFGWLATSPQRFADLFCLVLFFGRWVTGCFQFQFISTKCRDRKSFMGDRLNIHARFFAVAPALLNCGLNVAN
jgi:hypothetical protein